MRRSRRRQSLANSESSKAPWYFLGLQEMLVFFDPWHAGVVLPSLIIVGLMVIPYIDINPKGTATTASRTGRELLTFIFGFHILWVSLIVIGTPPRAAGTGSGPGRNGSPQGRSAHERQSALPAGNPRLLLVGGVRLEPRALSSSRAPVAMYAWVIWLKGLSSCSDGE